MRGATEPGVMPGDGSWKENFWHENLEGRVCFVSDLGFSCHICEIRRE